MLSKSEDFAKENRKTFCSHFLSSCVCRGAKHIIFASYSATTGFI